VYCYWSNTVFLCFLFSGFFIFYVFYVFLFLPPVGHSPRVPPGKYLFYFNRPLIILIHDFLVELFCRLKLCPRRTKFCHAVNLLPLFVLRPLVLAAWFYRPTLVLVLDETDLFDGLHVDCCCFDVNLFM